MIWHPIKFGPKPGEVTQLRSSCATRLEAAYRFLDPVKDFFALHAMQDLDVETFYDLPWSIIDASSMRVLYEWPSSCLLPWTKLRLVSRLGYNPTFRRTFLPKLPSPSGIIPAFTLPISLHRFDGMRYVSIRTTGIWSLISPTLQWSNAGFTSCTTDFLSRVYYRHRAAWKTLLYVMTSKQTLHFPLFPRSRVNHNPSCHCHQTLWQMIIAWITDRPSESWSLFLCFLSLSITSLDWRLPIERACLPNKVFEKTNISTASKLNRAHRDYLVPWPCCLGALIP